MKRRQHHPFFYYLLMLGLGMVVGCVPMATDLRKVGFNELQKGFAVLEKTPQLQNLHEVVVLKNIKVHVVGDRKYFNWDRAAAYGSPIAGYATSKNEIYVFGKLVKGKIIVNQGILGHELNHLLNFKNKNIANPDKLDDLGA